jgi:hypothetical protein
MSTSKHTLAPPETEKFIGEIRKLIEESRRNVAIAVNSAMSMLYWHIGKRIHEEVLRNERAEYGKSRLLQLCATHSRKNMALHFRKRISAE